MFVLYRFRRRPHGSANPCLFACIYDRSQGQDVDGETGSNHSGGESRLARDLERGSAGGSSD